MGSDFKPKDDSPEAQQEAAAKKNNVMSAFANVGDNLASGNSFGNYWLGQVNKKQTTQADAEKERQKQDDPMARQEKAAAYLKQKREMAEGKDQDDFRSSLADDTSQAAKAFKATLISAGLPADVVNNSSAKDLLAQGYSPAKLSEIRARAAVDFENAKRLKQMDISGDLAKVNAQKNTPKGQFDALPEDKKLTITELSKKNAAKNAIKNQINAVLKNWDSLSEDQQVAQGRTLLKTLNSAEGADAIGSEEAKRLGGKLEFAMGNLSPFNSNPIQFGRDLKGFKEQAQHSAKALENAVGANQSLIDESYGRSPAPSQEAPQDEFVTVISPKDGRPKRIPKSQAQAAIAAGGQLVTGPNVGAK